MEYNIDNNNLANIFLKIKTEIQQSRKTLKELLEIDYKYYKTIINLEEFENILDKFKNEESEKKIEQKVIIEYNGNPYITLNLCILAILTNITIILNYDDFMQGTNTFITKIVNNILNQFNINKLVYLKENKENADKIICIDDINKYNEYLRQGSKNVKFYSLNYIDFYSDSDEFENITELIYKYAENNQIYIESYSELDAIEAAKMIKSGFGKEVVLLTTNEDTKKIFEKEISNKKIHINKNPFKQEIKLINKEILYI